MSDEDSTVQRARKRLSKIRSFYAHLILYSVVNAILVGADLVAGTDGGRQVLGLDFAYLPILFWGVFVVGDALATFVFPAFFGESWMQSRLDRYVERERRVGHTTA